MPDRDTSAYGPLAVGFMALHDREFFARLLANPRPALTEMVSQGRLTLTDEDVDRVARAVEAGQRQHTPAEVLAMWDRWNTTGRVSAGDWVDNRGDWIDNRGGWIEHESRRPAP